MLYSCYPETQLGLLFIEQLVSEEVIIIRGAKRFSQYSGLYDSFKFNGSFLNQTILTFSKDSVRQPIIQLRFFDWTRIKEINLLQPNWSQEI